jgi:hypothetical protein
LHVSVVVVVREPVERAAGEDHKGTHGKMSGTVRWGKISIVKLKDSSNVSIVIQNFSFISGPIPAQEPRPFVNIVSLVIMHTFTSDDIILDFTIE